MSFEPCATCVAAERNPTADAFETGCRSCLARCLAATGAHLESAAAGRMTPRYRAALDTLFGDDWRAGSDAVKAWARRMRQSP